MGAWAGRQREEEYASKLDGFGWRRHPLESTIVRSLLIQEALSFAKMNGWGGSVGKIIAPLTSVGIGGDTLKENSQYSDVVTDVSTGHITNGSLSQLIRRRSTIALCIQGNFTRLNRIHDVPETITCDND